MTIRWSAVTGATGYTVYADTSPGVSKTSYTGKASASGTFHVWAGLTNGISYYFVVTAKNSYGESDDSGEVMAILSPGVSLPKTGQTTCYDGLGNVIACAGTGQDGELQTGVGWPSPRFTDNLDGTVTDNLSGLMWLEDTNCMSTQYPGFDAYDVAGDGRVAWQQGLDFVAGINGGTYPDCGAGYADWRLPNRNELPSLTDYSQSHPVLPPGHPFANVSGCVSWLSNNDGLYSWGYSIDLGRMNSGVCGGGDGGYVLPVRAGQEDDSDPNYPANISKTGQSTCYDGLGNVIACAGTGQDGEHQMGVAWPYPRFTDNGDGTVKDNLTGLVWLKDANCISTLYPGFDTDNTAGDGGVTWQHGLDFVAGINGGTYPDCGAGSSDWRLPNVNELRSLLNAEESLRCDIWLNGQGFDNVKGYYYWSSTTDEVLSSDFAWTVAFVLSFVDGIPKDAAVFVWPVRGGN